MTAQSRSKRLSAGVSALAVGVLLAACSSSPSSNAASGNATSSGSSSKTQTKLTFVGYGGSGQQGQIQAWQKPYTAQNPNVTFLNTSPAAVAQVKAQVLAGNIQWDVVNVAPYAAEQDCGTLFDKLSVPTMNPKDYPPGTIGSCYVGNFTNSPVLSYNVKDFPNPATAPKTVADFFNVKKFPGKRGIVADLQDGMMEYPLLADGVKPANLYPLNVNKALQTWDTIRSDTIFAPNVGALEQDVASNQVSMFILVSSRQLTLLNSGVDIKPIWQTTVAALNAFAVPKGDPNLAAAEKFIEFADQPGPSAKIAELDGVAPINLNSKPDLSKNAQLVNPFGPADTGTVVTQNVQWYAQNNNADTTILDHWLNG